MRRYLLLALCLLAGAAARADLDAVLHWQARLDLETVCGNLYKSQEKNKFSIAPGRCIQAQYEALPDPRAATTV